MEPAAVGREKLAARVTVVAGDEDLGEGLVKAVWTADTRAVGADQSPGCALHGPGGTGASDPGGLAARKNGDVATATEKLRRAMELASSRATKAQPGCSGQIIEVDKHTGTARLRRESRRRTRWPSMRDRPEPREYGRSPDADLPEGHARATDYCDVCGLRRNACTAATSPSGPARRLARHAARRSAAASVRRAVTTRRCPNPRSRPQSTGQPCRSDGPPSSPPIRSTTDAS